MNETDTTISPPLRQPLDFGMFSLVWMLCCVLALSPLTAAAQMAPKVSGTITEVIRSANYSYFEVNTGSAKVWAAGINLPPLKKGETVSFDGNMAMRNYYSKVLDRDFALVYFIQRVDSGGSADFSMQQLQQQIDHAQSAAPAVSRLLKQTREVAIGDVVPDSALNGLLGESKRLVDYRGKPLLINVWASWCSPCRAEMGSLQRLAERFDGKQFNLIGVSTDDYRDKAEGMIRESGIKFANFIDHKLTLEKLFGARTIPLTLLVDANGRLLHKVSGARAWDSAESLKLISRHFGVGLAK